jgi:hypothetical protein
MDEQEFLAAAAQHDARVMAAAVGGRVTSDPQQFLDALSEDAARRELRDTDTRSVDQIADEVGQLYQRFLDAWWYCTPDQTRQAAEAFARAMEHPAADRLYVHAAAIQVGDYVRAVGYDPDGERDAATGVVEDVAYTERVVDPYGFGEPDSHYGFAFTLLPVVRADRRFAAHPVDIWVRETGSPDVLRLPTPVDRGRQAWLNAAAQPVDAPATNLAGGRSAATTHPAALARNFDFPGGTATTPATGSGVRPGRARPSTQPPTRAPGSPRR